jgi:ankyrin repeat protein
VEKTLLLQPRIDVNKAKNNGETPLSWAANKGHLEVVKALLAHPGIDVNKADKYGQTPLARAHFYNQTEIANLITEHLNQEQGAGTVALWVMSYFISNPDNVVSPEPVQDVYRQSNCSIL